MRLDRYIFLEWLKVFVLTIFAILGILLLAEIQDELGDLLDLRVAPVEILRYFGLVLPTFIPQVVPISFLLSMLYVLGQMHRHHEITAMSAGGLSLWRISRTLWLGGALLAVLLFYINGQYVPRAVETVRTMRQNFSFASELAQQKEVEEVGALYNLTFYNHADGRLWFINRFNEYTYRAYGLTISELTPDGMETRRLLANEAYFNDLENHWVLQNGRELSFDPQTGAATRNIGFEERVFEQLDEDPNLMKFLEKRPKDLSFFQLNRVVNALAGSGDPRINSYAIQYYEILFSPFSCLVMVGIAVPFAIAGVRTNAMVGVSKAMGLFFLYYLVVNISNVFLAQRLPASVIAFLPNAAMAGLGVFLFIRASKPK